VKRRPASLGLRLGLVSAASGHLPAASVVDGAVGGAGGIFTYQCAHNRVRVVKNGW